MTNNDPLKAYDAIIAHQIIIRGAPFTDYGVFCSFHQVWDDVLMESTHQHVSDAASLAEYWAPKTVMTSSLRHRSNPTVVIWTPQTLAMGFLAVVFAFMGSRCKNFCEQAKQIPLKL